MRYLILADIHANLAALSAVLDDAAERGEANGVWCLGDLVGYGPDPNDVVATLCRYEPLCVVGNHDLAAIGGLDLREFNHDAAAAALWTGHRLDAASASYLAGLPQVLCQGDFTLVHGSPRAPIWEYLVSIRAARAAFEEVATPYCLVGHSHVPLMFAEMAATGRCLLMPFVPDQPLPLGENRLVINPGSVGQPRDGDPRAAYAIFDSEKRTIGLHRVPYDIAATQRRMQEAGLPPSLAYRLAFGW